MGPHRSVPLHRLALVAVTGTALAGAGAALVLPVAARLARHRAALDSAPPADLLAGVAALVLLACLTRLWLSGMASVVRLAWGLTTAPRAGLASLVHRAVLAGCGMALAGGALAPAAAVPTPLHEEPRHVSLHAQPATQPARSGTAATWTVRSGDTLWAIAASSLDQQQPPNGAVAARVDELHRLNRAAVPDRDLIHPGQLLRLPTA